MTYRMDQPRHEELTLLVRSGHSMIVMETHEERRAMNVARQAARDMECDACVWTAIQGLVALDEGGGAHPISSEDTTDPVAALACLGALDRPWIATMLDPHPHLESAKLRRALREVATRAARRHCAVCLVAPVIQLPIELERVATRFPVPLPDGGRLESLVRDVYKRVRDDHGDIAAELRRQDLDRIVEALLGLTEEEAERVLRQVMLRDRRLDAYDVEEIREWKRLATTTRGKLESVPVGDDLRSLGGLDQLKAWLKRRHKASSSKAAEFGLTPPKGVLLLGVPGCGKSLCARLIAGEWKRPLLRMETGALYDRFIGVSEANLRESLRQAESMAPCVLWIDEIEKAFASSGTTADSGLSQRLFANILSWMNDRVADVFTVATANDVSRLPPELMRKGRFDEIFFVDLPPDEARRQIFKIHLEKRRREPSKFDLDALVRASSAFSGAEIEQAVVGALYRAFDEAVELTTRHVLDELSQTQPMAATMREHISGLRRWASDRCVMAH